MRTETVSARLNPGDRDRLNKIADSMRRTKGDLLRYIILEAINVLEKQNMEASNERAATMQMQ